METKVDVHFNGRSDVTGENDVVVESVFVETLVTSCPYKVEEWIRGTENWNNRRLHRLIVGFNIEWRPNTTTGQENPVAFLQLFVGKRGLIYQLHKIPKVLKKFLKNPNYTFVGVGIESDKEKLYRDYSLTVRKSADLREMAAYELADPELKEAGLKKLAKVILGKNVDDGNLVEGRTSDRQSDQLSNAQVMCASLNAHGCRNR